LLFLSDLNDIKKKPHKCNMKDTKKPKETLPNNRFGHAPTFVHTRILLACMYHGQIRFAPVMETRSNMKFLAAQD
jgi:hypothetical protein